MALGFAQELHVLAAQLAASGDAEAARSLDEAVAHADERHAELKALGLVEQDLEPTLRWSAAVRLLRDLRIQGWSFSLDDEGLLLRPPGQVGGGNDPEVQKEAIRRSFRFARDAQLVEPSTRRFIEGMERRGVEALFADGAELATRLRTRGADAVEPELVLIEPDARDPETGLRLQDVWRYARHFWSIPYQSTPGRNMFYLVRDAACPGRPLIGIAALGNPVLGLAPRDDYAGWSVRGLRGQLAAMDSRRANAVGRTLLAALEEGIAETYAEDLPRLDGADWRQTVAALEAVERTSAGERLDNLGASAEGTRDPEYLLIRGAHTAVAKGLSEEVDWHALARTRLYTRKRAASLATFVRARGTLQELGAPRRGWLERALGSTEGCRAVETALRRIKQAAISSSVMELITCGAVPPYRDALGGKLVALLMLSRTVVADYEAKYSGQVSLIASALAGKPVTRPTTLALVTTSSLYDWGSSQYNRLRVPVGDASVSYRRIGTTDSFGTVHVASDTVAALEAVTRLSDENRRRINNLFGEGTSPKLRMVRSGLEALGLDGEVFLRHHSPRLLYGAALAENTADLLLGLAAKPRYVLPSGPKSDAILIAHWRERWLAPRIARPEVLDRIAAERHDSFLLGTESALAAGDDAGTDEHAQPTALSTGAAVGEPKTTFIERLYRNANSYADRLSSDELEDIHVDLGVDGYLLEAVERGKQVIITGNPGDGKTHLIERLRPQLEASGAEVITDANAMSDAETLITWRACRDEKRPFVLAINEWPLYVLQRQAREWDFPPVGEALRQVREARFFVDSQLPAPPELDVLTIDLSMRNLLAPAVVARVVERLTDERFFAGLNDADPMLANRRALREPQVVERLSRVLDLVAVRIGHATMRQLVGFVAYLLSGGRSAAERLKAGQDAAALSYANLAFEGGDGVLFDAVRRVFDPAAVAHPGWDERLWRGELQDREWLRRPPASVLALSEQQRSAGFRAAKRQFFFEHAQGNCLLDLVPKDEEAFEEILVEGGAGKTSVVRDLVLALNRFYEPDFPEQHRDRLLLWQSHRYDVRAPAAFVSLRQLDHQHLRLERLRYADWVERWLPPEQQSRRSFAIVASDTSARDVALLDLDRELYLTLIEAQRGLGRSSWSRTATRRVTRFVDRIDRALETPHGIEDLRIRNVESDLDERFAVQRTPPRYQL